MTQTNGMAREGLTVIALLQVMAKIECETHKIPVEYKMHQDDFTELRKQLLPHEIKLEPNRPPEMLGLRIVLDYSAERLPRK